MLYSVNEIYTYAHICVCDSPIISVCCNLLRHIQFAPTCSVYMHHITQCPAMYKYIYIFIRSNPAQPPYTNLQIIQRVRDCDLFIKTPKRSRTRLIERERRAANSSIENTLIRAQLRFAFFIYKPPTHTIAYSTTMYIYIYNCDESASIRPKYFWLRISRFRACGEDNAVFVFVVVVVVVVGGRSIYRDHNMYIAINRCGGVVIVREMGRHSPIGQVKRHFVIVMQYNIS